ncbi:hypothetical protein NL676_036423 [Syzygium grande]|nr:hypothetical protein NL676_036423 [Syzygium grande]
MDDGLKKKAERAAGPHVTLTRKPSKKESGGAPDRSPRPTPPGRPHTAARSRRPGRRGPRAGRGGAAYSSEVLRLSFCRRFSCDIASRARGRGRADFAIPFVCSVARSRMRRSIGSGAAELVAGLMV